MRRLAMRRLATALSLLAGAVGLEPRPVVAAEWTTGQTIGDTGLLATGVATVSFKNTTWVFATVRNQVQYKTSTDLQRWSPWASVGASTRFAPAVAVLGKKLYLFTVDANNKIEIRTTQGTTWSAPSSGGGAAGSAPSAVEFKKKIYVATVDPTGRPQYASTGGGPLSPWTQVQTLISAGSPALASFGGSLLMVARKVNGTILFGAHPFATWTAFSSTVESSPSVAISRGKMFVFATTSGRAFYRIVDSTHGRLDIVPLDRWVPAGEGRSPGPFAAYGTPSGVHLFFGGVEHRGLPPLSTQTAVVYQRSNVWSEIQLAVIQVADTPATPGGFCAGPADLGHVDPWILTANSVWASSMIQFRRVPASRVCSSVLNSNDWEAPAIFQANTIGDAYPGKIPLFVRNIGAAGGFAGPENRFVALPEAATVCDDDDRHMVAHELGHYLGLEHTHVYAGPGLSFTTNADLVRRLTAVNCDTVAAFDLDLTATYGFDAAPLIRDTPPDPYFKDGECWARTQVVKVKCQANGQTYSLVPSRTNAMSYYQVDDKVLNSLTPDQTARAYWFVRARGLTVN
jgi:hypothetical protein